MAAVVMIIVIAVVGAGSYFAFKGTTSNGGSSSKSITNCSPPSSPICSTISGGHDVLMSEPFRVSYQSTQIPFTAAYTGSGSVLWYNFTFGDGTFKNQTTPTAPHQYDYPGTYLASVQAFVGGSWHDNYNRLLLVQVQPGVGLANTSFVPAVQGTITGNGTSGATNPSAVVASGGAVTVNGSYNGNPSDSAATPIAPTLTVSSGGTLSGVTAGTTFVTGTATFAHSGTYWIKMVGGSTVGSTTYTQNYIWTVFAAPSGSHAGYVLAGAGSATGGGLGGSKVYSSPHSGNLNIYEYTGTGGTSLDPAIDYETVGYEPILNLYETLIAYNLSKTGPNYLSYVPVLSTCVPGSPECQAQWGASFTGISADNQNFTFVIDPNARFYDHANSASWAVYPSDVMFSLARTMAWSTNPCIGCNNGWIVTQALLGTGNGSWDGGLHGAMNNTPAPVFASMTVNDSNCPAAAMTQANGCITFHANAGGVPWPYFLELIADGLGGSVVPCGWFSAQAQGAGIPGWTNGTEGPSDHGDHPCTLPGGATSTNDAAYATAVAAMGPTSWDSWESAGGSPPWIGTVSTSAVGSAPYYLSDYVAGASYTLKANPAYAQPMGCTWSAALGCDPAPGQYAPDVSVTWEINSATQGEQAYQAGTADFASVPVTDLSFLLKLVNAGTVNLASSPTLSIYFWPYNLNFDGTAEKSTLVGSLNVPNDWFSYVGMRQFFAHAYPYDTTLNTIGIKNGISFYQNYGGAIPHGMANYYGGNISWPAGDPNGSASTQGTAAWWWSQVTTSTSQYYDSEAAGCTSGSPCIVAMIGQTAAPDLDQRIADWQKSISTLTGGAIQLATTDISFGNLVGNSLYKGPGQNPMPVYQLGWAPDYPDPTDYVGPLYAQNSSYPNPDAVWQQLGPVGNGFNDSTCHTYTDFGWWAAQANSGGIPTNCQGAAYSAMQWGMHAASAETNLNTRLVEYWQVQSIANGLALFLYWGQQIHVPSYAAWIDGNSLNNNVTIGGGSDQLWYMISGKDVAYKGAS